MARVQRAADKGEKEQEPGEYNVQKEMVDAPDVSVTKDEEKVLTDAQVAELEENRRRAQVVTEATKETDTDPVVESADVPTPKKAGTVEVRVLHDVFPYIDQSGSYQAVTKGKTCKVTSAQADRGEELGAVERV